MFGGIIQAVKDSRPVQIALLVAVIVIIYVAWIYVQKDEEEVKETLDNTEPELVQPELTLTSDAAPTMEEQQQVDTIVAGKDQLTAEELLPAYDEADEFAKQNPVGKLLKEQNFLISGYHMGINTVVQSNKIPYHDIRSAPPIAKKAVSPFLNSSYDTPMGSGRRQLEIA